MMLAAFDLLQIAPALCLLVCLLGVLGIIAAQRRPNLREAISLMTAVVNFVLVLWMYVRHEAGSSIECELVRIVEGLRIAFKVDELGLIFALVASGLWIVNTLYSIGYMRAHQEQKQTRFYACFAIAIAACMGAAFSANLFAMFAFYELLSLCTYPLVIHTETPEAKAGAKRYLTYLLGTSIGFQLPAIMVVWNIAGTLDFAPGGIAAIAASGHGPLFLSLVFLLFVVGIAKCGLMPLHSWLPAAMVAPTPVSALLHAVAVVKMGVFCVCRVVFHVFGSDLLQDLGVANVLVVAACFTIVTGSLVALVQDNLKRRLAYSTISQLSYILLGAAMLTPDSITGGVAHIAFHACAKITLFFAAGAIFVALHKTKVSQLDGIGRRMPLTMTAFAIASLSMIGLPPTAGLVSKWYLVLGAIDGGWWAVLAVLVVSALLNAAYFLPIVWRAFFKPIPPGEETGFKEAPVLCVVALGVTALATVWLFFAPDLFLNLARAVAGVAS